MEQRVGVWREWWWEEQQRPGLVNYPGTEPTWMIWYCKARLQDVLSTGKRHNQNAYENDGYDSWVEDGLKARLTAGSQELLWETIPVFSKEMMNPDRRVQEGSEERLGLRDGKKA